MSDNKRNIDHDIDEAKKVEDGNRHPTGTGTQAAHRVEAERAAETKDRQAQGVAGRQSGQGPGTGKAGTGR